MNCRYSERGKRCLAESGDNIVCDFHRKTGSKRGKDILDGEWREEIVDTGYDKESGKYICFHCGRSFPRKSVCGDHFPFTKGARPDLRYCLKNGVCSCKVCNQSGSDTRRASFKKWASRPYSIPAPPDSTTIAPDARTTM